VSPSACLDPVAAAAPACASDRLGQASIASTRAHVAGMPLPSSVQPSAFGLQFRRAAHVRLVAVAQPHAPDWCYSCLPFTYATLLSLLVAGRNRLGASGDADHPARAWFAYEIVSVSLVIPSPMRRTGHAPAYPLERTLSRSRNRCGGLRRTCNCSRWSAEGCLSSIACARTASAHCVLARGTARLAGILNLLSRQRHEPTAVPQTPYQTEGVPFRHNVCFVVRSVVNSRHWHEIGAG
jgi:hypothetical protein